MATAIVCTRLRVPLSFSLAILILHVSFLVPSSSSSMSVGDEKEAPIAGGGGGAETVTRESFPMDGDVEWVVQVSDLHISAYYPDRAGDLVAMLAPFLRLIRPALLLITGDITDAKSKSRTSTRQDVSEWVKYKDTVEEIVKLGGIEKRRIFDIRGNHDKYGVPCVGDELDFFSTQSVSAQLKRLSTIQSISLVGDDKKYVFVGIDDTVSIGIRGPSNLFGHPSSDRIAVLESELQHCEDSPGYSVTKVVFGHFPMSFTTSAENGERYESLFARKSISSYICGHLHATFGRQLWRRHALKVPSNARMQKDIDFWEWELGDWKDSRFVRILAIDRGVVTFRDIQLFKNSEGQGHLETVIHLTYPIDSRSMNRIGQNNQSIRNDINALIFSTQQIMNVTAKVFDSSRGFKIVEEVPLLLVDNGNGVDKPLFHGRWNAGNYKSSSATRYLLQVTVVDSKGKETTSELRPFSVEGKLAHRHNKWLASLVFDVEWESLYLVLLWTNLSFLAILLILPRILNYVMERHALYQKWVFTESDSSPGQERKLHFWVLFFFLEGSKNRVLWFSMVTYILCLLMVPWFWGHATSENGDIGSMYLSGWKLSRPNSRSTADKLGIPDIMTIVLPFMYLVVTPIIILVYSLYAERSKAHLHSKRNLRAQNESNASDIESELGPQHADVPLLESVEGVSTSSAGRFCCGFKRLFLVFGCLIIVLVHFKLCSSLMLAYGAGPVTLSPLLTWAPPMILVAALYSTSTNDRPIHKET